MTTDPTSSTIASRLHELTLRRLAETPAELARFVIINTSTCEALAIDFAGNGNVIETMQVPLWFATRFPRVQGRSTKSIVASVHGKSVRVKSMYVYWQRKLQCELDELNVGA